MEDQRIRGPSRTLLDCSSSDHLCIVRTYQNELIIVPVFLVGGTAILLAIILYLRYRSRKPVEEQTQDTQQRQGYQNAAITLEELSLEAVLRTKDASLEDVEIPQDRIGKPLQLVGEGRFGPMYRTVLRDPDGGRDREIIIKQLKSSAEPREVRYFLQRAAFQNWLGQHTHLVEMMGCCSEQEPFYIIQENMEPGCLLNFLWDCRRDVISMHGILYDITEYQVYAIALQILSALVGVILSTLAPITHRSRTGSGYDLDTSIKRSMHTFHLEFLHQRSLVHGDVAARNILIHRNFTAKLCGLGGACEMRLKGTFPFRRPAPLKWMAPERLLHLPLSGKADVWSFGIFMYEMITLGAPPYPEIPSSSILQYLQRGNIILRPSSCKPTMYSIMKSCWSWKASDRVSLPDLRKRLEVGKKNSNDKTVLQIPELVVPELYAGVAGTEILKMEIDYTVL